MYGDFNRYRVLREFFDYPTQKFQLREIARDTGISFPSIRNHVKKLEKDGFLEKIEQGVYPGYKLADSEKTRLYKRNDLLVRLYESGLIDDIEKKSRPNCILLYGSSVEGRDDERGDIDLFVQAREVSIPLAKYEHELKRTVSLLFEPDIKKINKELLNNLVNGIILKGYFKVK